ncbi:nucleotide-binding protein [Rathayibacter sp. VKM Ac-2835]|nr:nucleotide-binding protein [Rathayibacter sp. VKM Ac-2835]NRG41615.1 nucleotide-binding protein [Rathayibacter sp. VKM Ac-2835]
MTVPAEALVFDTGPMRHFAAEGWLGVLKFLAGDRPVVIPDAVERELHSAPGTVFDGLDLSSHTWIKVFRSTDLDFLSAVASVEDRLVADRKNVGECAVLALGQRFGCELVIDDSVARSVAREHGLRLTATVPLLCQGRRSTLLTLAMVESLVDDLLQGEYFLPFGRGGFRQHALETGLLEYEDI